MANSVKKNLMYSVVFTYVEFILGLVITIIIARALGPSDYGLYSYLLRVAAILLVVVNAGVSTGVLRFIAEYTNAPSEQQKVLGYTVYKFYKKIQLVKTFVVLLAFYGLGQHVFGWVVDVEQAVLLLVVTVAVGFKSYYMFCVGALKGIERFDLLAKISFLALPVNLSAVAFGAWLDAGLDYYVWVYLAASCFFLIMALAFMKGLFQKGQQLCLVSNFEQRSKDYVKIVALSTVIGTLLFGYVEVFYLKLYTDIEHVGFFNLGFMIAGAAIALVPGVYNAILMPRVVKHVSNAQVGENSPEFVFGIIRHMLILHLAVSLPAAVYAPELMSFLFGEQYSAVARVLTCLLIVNLVKSVIDPTNAFLVSHDKQGRLLILNGLMLCVSVLLGFVFVSRFGLYGATISYSITLGLLALGQLILVRQALGSFALKKEIFKVILASLMAIVVVIYLVQFPWAIVNVIFGSALFLFLFVVFLWRLDGFTKEEIAEWKAVVRTIRR